jgi:glyoxylase-like metal-dependent hydrolase (beta-lactamase superfamily II)
MREIVDGILHWTWFSERHGYDFNGYFVRDGRVAIDPVELSDETLGELAEEGVATIVLTNRNHFRDAAKLRARTGARVLVHADDAPFVRGKGVEVDGAIADGDRVGPFEVIGVPGKSPGEVALSWPARRLLVVGDACVGAPPGALRLLPPAVVDDMGRLKESLRALAGRLPDLEVLLVGDGAPILSSANAALRALVATFA